jgi:hypothetical protein
VYDPERYRSAGACEVCRDGQWSALGILLCILIKTMRAISTWIGRLDLRPLILTDSVNGNLVSKHVGADTMN